MDMDFHKEVSFEDVKAVLWELTGEGGRFYNMQRGIVGICQRKVEELLPTLST